MLSAKVILVAAIVMLATATGLSLVATDPGQDQAPASSNVATGSAIALGEAREAAASRQVSGVIARARATGPGRPAGGLGAGRQAEAPSIATATPAPVPGLAAEPVSNPPSASEPSAPSSPPASAPPAPMPSAPAPPAEPTPPVTVPPNPAPSPQPEPEPSPGLPPKTSNPDIDPGVPVEPPAPQPGLLLGIDGGYAGWIPSEVAQRAALGAAVTRHEWHISNPATSEEDQVLAAATEIGTRILALLGGNDIGEPEHYRDWVVAFVRHYGPGGAFWDAHPELDESRYAIDTIELGNEPYFGTMSAEDYADTVRPALEAVDQLDLPVKVLLPAYLHGENISWIDTLYARIPNLNSLYYAPAFHPYWYGHHPATAGDGGPFERIETLRQTLDRLGAAAKPIYLTEYGESTAACGEECVNEAEQAEHLGAMIEAVATNADWRIGLLSVFQLLDRGTNSPDRELQFGLLREDGTPKPAYEIVRAAMQLYR
jgi:hypothetical protein